MGNFKQFKRRRLLKLYWAKLRADVRTDMKNRVAQIVLLGLLIYLGIVALPTVHLKTVAIASTVAIVIYLSARTFFAYRGCLEDEMKIGQWFGSKFLYHTPRHVFTTQVGPEDNQKAIHFTAEGAEPNTLVRFDVEHHGGSAKAYVASPYQRQVYTWGADDRDTQYLVRINEKSEAFIVIDCPKDSDITTIIIRMFSWEWDDANKTRCAFKVSAIPVAKTELPPECIKRLADLKGEKASVQITRHDNEERSRLLAQEISRAFDEAGWHVSYRDMDFDILDKQYGIHVEIIWGDEELAKKISSVLKRYGIRRISTNHYGTFVKPGAIRIEL